ncbi:MAG: helix-turn-helix domain containing protein [Candidatus Eisenbacteria bacterium]
MAGKSRGDSKHEALRKEGTLNPHPRAVTNPLFEKSEFFDPNDLLQVKYEMLRQASEERRPVIQVAPSFGFSRVTFYEIRKRFLENGLAGLFPRRRGPQRAHKLTDGVLDYVEEMLGEEPSLGARALADRVESRFGITVHPRSIERALARRQKKGQR